MTGSSRLKRNDVFVMNSDDTSFAVVIEEHRSNGEVRWTRHPVPPHSTAGQSCSVDRFLEDHSPIDGDTDLARSVVQGASVLVAKLPRPSRWAGYTDPSVAHVAAHSRSGASRRKQTL